MKKFLLLLFVLLFAFFSAVALDEEENPIYVEFVYENIYEIPEDGDYCYFYACEIDRVIIGENCRGMDFDYTTIKYFEVSPNHPDWVSVDGVVFTKDQKTLLYYPSGREDDHYDVPVGTEAIGTYAFYDCWTLHSVSLPFGMKRLEYGAFAFSGVESMVFPLTMESVGDLAFADCLLLEQVSMPDWVTVGDLAFSHCYKLLENEEWETRIVADYSGLDMIASPAEVSNRVKVYDAPNGKHVLESYACGNIIRGVFAYNQDWYFVKDAGGYVRRSEVSPYLQNSLFDVANVRVKNKKVMMYGWEGGEGYSKLKSYEKTLTSIDKELKEMAKDLDEEPAPFDETMVQGAIDDTPSWCYIYYDNPEDDYYSFYYYFQLQDAIVTRKYTGDNKTFGMVVASEPQNRVKLRAKPSQKADIVNKFFSGTQLEILETQKDWYKVRIGFQDGYMMKEFVMIVDQEEK